MVSLPLRQLSTKDKKVDVQFHIVYCFDFTYKVYQVNSKTKGTKMSVSVCLHFNRAHPRYPMT